MDRFTEPTYLILELPKNELTQSIVELRRKYEPWRAEIPVEISVVGSSGIGPFARNEQSVQAAFRIVDSIARTLRPIQVSFRRITHFPGTQIYYLEPAESEVFRKIQDQLIASGIHFEKSQYHFTPHCTIADLSHVSTQEAVEDVHRLQFEGKTFELKCLEFYVLSNHGGRAIHRVELK